MMLEAMQSLLQLWTIAAANQVILQKIKLNLTKIFNMKYLGELHWLLNLKIEYDIESKMISFSQPAYIDRIIEKFNI